MVLPLQLARSLAKKQGQVELGVDLTKAVVRSGSKNQIVFGTFHLGISRVIPLGVKVVGVLVDVRIMQSHISRRNNHGACNQFS